MTAYFIDPLDAYQRPHLPAPTVVIGPYGGPTPDLDDLPLPDADGLDRRAEERVAEIWGAA